jgi:hypothetical protein
LKATPGYQQILERHFAATWTDSFQGSDASDTMNGNYA